MNNTPVAFFDFDGTLTRRDTMLPFLRQYVGNWRFFSDLLLLSPVLLGYVAKLIPNDVAKQKVLRRYLAEHRQDALYAEGCSFARTGIPALLRPEGMEKLAWHQGQGHECVLVSASLDIYLRAWTDSQGMGLLCSKLAVDAEGCVSGRLDGNNCYGPEKVVQVKNWLNGRTPERIYAYGDTSGDLPLLNFADEGLLWRGKAFIRIK
jgi:HAD superfamily hydrolase (TIGR01490 family)